MSEDQLKRIEEGKFTQPLTTIALLTAEVRRLRMYIEAYTAVECRGSTYYPEWAERALRD